MRQCCGYVHTAPRLMLHMHGCEWLCISKWSNDMKASRELNRPLCERVAAEASAAEEDAAAEVAVAAAGLAEATAAPVTPPQQAAVAAARDAARSAWHKAAQASQAHAQQPCSQPWPAAQPGGYGRPWADPAVPPPWSAYPGEEECARHDMHQTETTRRENIVTSQSAHRQQQTGWVCTVVDFT